MTTADIVATTILGVCTVLAIVLGVYTIADRRRASRPTINIIAQADGRFVVHVERGPYRITGNVADYEAAHAFARDELAWLEQENP
jgi:hypothetical protein